jgi:hypothetical protein
MIVTLVPDVLFSAKINQLAKDKGLQVTNAKTVEQFKETVLVSKPKLALVDLNAKGLKAMEAVSFLREYHDTSFGNETLRVVAFYSHLDKEAAETAKREGLKEVMPRSEFTKLLPDLIRELSAGPQSGASKITLIVFGALIAVVTFCAYKILPFYYYYYDFQNQMEQVIRVASTTTDKEIRQKLVYYMHSFDIPAAPEELKIQREGNTMKISLPYQEVFYITWRGKDYDLYVFKFHAYAEGKF